MVPMLVPGVFGSSEVRHALVQAHASAAHDVRKEASEVERTRELLARAEAGLSEAMSRRQALADAISASGPMPTRRAFGGRDEVYSLEKAEFVASPMVCHDVAAAPRR